MTKALYCVSQILSVSVHVVGVGINVILCGVIRSNVRGEYNYHLRCPHETSFLDQISVTFEEKAKKNQNSWYFSLQNKKGCVHLKLATCKMLLMPFSWAVSKSPELIHDFTGNKLKVGKEGEDCIASNFNDGYQLLHLSQSRDCNFILINSSFKLTTTSLRITWNVYIWRCIHTECEWALRLEKRVFLSARAATDIIVVELQRKSSSHGPRLKIIYTWNLRPCFSHKCCREH